MSPAARGGHRGRIRPAVVEADLPALLAIHRASFSQPWTEGLVRAEAHASTHRDWSGLVVVDDAAAGIVAFLASRLVVDELEITTVAVAPDHRRRGLAAALLRERLDAARRAGAAAAWLELRVSNGSARRLYRRLGFDVVGRRKAYYRAPDEDALVMQTSLGPVG